MQTQDEFVPAGWTTRFWSDIALALRRLARELRNAKPAGLGAKGKRADGSICVWAYISWERDSQETPYGVGFDLWSADCERFGAAMDAAVDKSPFGDDEWWYWGREGGPMEHFTIVEVARPQASPERFRTCGPLETGTYYCLAAV